MATGPAAEILRAMQRRRREVEAAWKRGTQKATALLAKRSRERLRAGVYNKPVPKVKRVRGKDKGKTVKKWRQTGNLRRAEKHRIVGPYTGHVYNNATYSLARHNLGLSAGDPDVLPPPPKRKRNTEREAPWRAQAIEDTKHSRLEAYHKEVGPALEQP